MNRYKLYEPRDPRPIKSYYCKGMNLQHKLNHDSHLEILDLVGTNLQGADVWSCKQQWDSTCLNYSSIDLDRNYEQIQNTNLH